MIFNSVAFFGFLAVFLPLYFSLKGKARLLLCLAGSYFFYAWWDWRFLSLIAFSTMIDYTVGLYLEDENDEQKRKRLLITSMVVNIGFFGIFKYLGFFVDSFHLSFGTFINEQIDNIVLPVGISFYTFQSMSYTIDVYYRKIKVERDLIRFSTFLAFFPQLVAGPIVRASDFLPQFQKDREFSWDRLISGSGQMVWGFFKKVAIADSLAPFVDLCFAAPDGFASIQLLIGIIFWSFQIYCDFSGYSDIAIGLARVLGFDFPENFRTPYFSKNFSEFWRRWHISLSSWLRDYLYIPLGGSRSGSFGSYFFILVPMLITVIVTKWWWLILVFAAVTIGTAVYMRGSDANKIRGYTYMNNMVTMLLGGLWHGAGWAFLFWGFLHGFYLIVQRQAGPPFGKIMTALRIPKFAQQGIDILIVYFFTCLAWVFFRAPDFEIATKYIVGIASFENFHLSAIVNKPIAIKGFILIAMLLFVEISDLKINYGQLIKNNATFRVVSFALVLWLIAFFGTFGSNSFIYFQF